MRRRGRRGHSPTIAHAAPRLVALFLILATTACLKAAEESRAQQAVHDVYNGLPPQKSAAIALLVRDQRPTAKTIAALRYAASDSEPRIRVAALRGLVTLKTPTDTMRAVLFRALGDDDERVRYAAVAILSADEYRDVLFLGALVIALRDSSSAAVRAAAAVAIGLLGEGARPALADLARATRDSNAIVKHQARDAIRIITSM